MKQILCLSNEPWSASPGRTQQLVSRLRNAQILYFSPPAQRGKRGRHELSGQVRPNVTVFTLPHVLEVDERHGLLFRASRRKLARFIASKAGRRRGAPLLWTTHPEHVHLLDLLDYGGLVYDCDRVWDELPPKWEGGLAMAADVVFAASPQLRERLSPCSSNIALLPNGVNYSLFSGLGFSAPRRSGRGPVIGFLGTVRPELDLSPLLYAARKRPGWSFLLVGPVEEGNLLLPPLSRLPNVRLTGPCPLSQTPDRLRRCDVLVELLRRDQPYTDVVPSRLYEYLSTGRPVVSMLWPDQVEQFPDVVYAAYSEEEFVTCVQHALEEAPDFVSQRRRDHGAAASWTLRAQAVDRILSAAGLL